MEVEINKLKQNILDEVTQTQKNIYGNNSLTT